MVSVALGVGLVAGLALASPSGNKASIARAVSGEGGQAGAAGSASAALHRFGKGMKRQ